MCVLGVRRVSSSEIQGQGRCRTEGCFVPIQTRHFQDRPHGTQSVTWASALHHGLSSLAAQLSDLRSSIASRSLKPSG